jgi:hypothetical protein
MIRSTAISWQAHPCSSWRALHFRRIWAKREFLLFSRQKGVSLLCRYARKPGWPDDFMKKSPKSSVYHTLYILEKNNIKIIFCK